MWVGNRAVSLFEVCFSLQPSSSGMSVFKISQTEREWIRETHDKKRKTKKERATFSDYASRDVRSVMEVYHIKLPSGFVKVR